MLKRNSDGSFIITGLGNVHAPDAKARRDARTAKAEGDPLAGIVGEGLGLRRIQPRIDAITSRDSVAQRNGLAKSYARMNDALLADKMPVALPEVLRVAQQFKPEAARPLLEQKVPAVLGGLREKLMTVIEGHRKERLAPAKECLAAALAAEIPSDPGAAAAQGIVQMEVRSRLLAMPAAERTALIGKLAGEGRFDALAAVRADPLGPCIDLDVLAAAERQALAAAGAGWLVEDVEAAEAEGTQLAALATTLLDGISQEMRDAGVPAPLVKTPPEFQGFFAQTNPA